MAAPSGDDQCGERKPTDEMLSVCDLIERADQALYAAKRGGRNLCVVR